MLTQATHIEMVCENPDCGVSFKWIEEEIAKDPDNLPDGCFRFIIFAPFIGSKHTFCSKYCLLEWLKSYVAPQSPREQRLAQKAVADAATAKDIQAAKIESMEPTTVAQLKGFE